MHRHTAVKAAFPSAASNQHAGAQDTHSTCTSCLGHSCQLDSCVRDSGLVFCGVLDAQGCVHSREVSILTICAFINHTVGVSYYKPSQWACGLICHVASGQCPWYHPYIRPTSNFHGGYYHSVLPTQICYKVWSQQRLCNRVQLVQLCLASHTRLILLFADGHLQSWFPISKLCFWVDSYLVSYDQNNPFWEYNGTLALTTLTSVPWRWKYCFPPQHINTQIWKYSCIGRRKKKKIKSRNGRKFWGGYNMSMNLVTEFDLN